MSERGDSVLFDRVKTTNLPLRDAWIPTDRKISLISENPPDPLPKQNFEATVEHLCWDYLEIYCGWENNDGAFGTFVFDVPAGTVTLEHNERFTDVNTTSHEF